MTRTPDDPLCQKSEVKCSTRGHSPSVWHKLNLIFGQWSKYIKEWNAFKEEEFKIGGTLIEWSMILLPKMFWCAFNQCLRLIKYLGHSQAYFHNQYWRDLKFSRLWSYSCLFIFHGYICHYCCHWILEAVYKCSSWKLKDYALGTYNLFKLDALCGQ